MKLLIKKIGMTVAIVAALVFVGTGLSDASVHAAPACKSGTISGGGTQPFVSTDKSPDCTVCIAVNGIEGKTLADLKKECEGTGSTTVNNVWEMARGVINWILIAAGIIAVGFIIWAGIRYITSGGDSEKVKKAKNTLLYAIVGLLIAALAMVIVNLVLNVGGEVTDPTPTPSSSAEATKAN